ncbi:MAG TPA: glycerol-3-phosphate 1-O-acyltransferase [Bacteroidetes bacterium]|nr:glycerol-3-phosphate 1-O-acyltransferase [Bacteroidota bacterium]
MDWMWYVLILTGAYLLGSIPTAVWIGRLFFGLDIRDHGSKNAGATNTIRVLGFKAGIPVLIVDVLKGFLAVKLITLLPEAPVTPEGYVRLQLLLGILSVVGHIFPVFAGFRGGKGVATMTGILIALHPIITLICAGVFFLTLFLSRYVSLSSILAGVSYPVLVIFVFRTPLLSMIIFSILIAVVLILTHQKNIGRLIRNEESKADFLLPRKKR